MRINFFFIFWLYYSKNMGGREIVRNQYTELGRIWSFFFFNTRDVVEQFHLPLTSMLIAHSVANGRVQLMHYSTCVIHVFSQYIYMSNLINFFPWCVRWLSLLDSFIIVLQEKIEKEKTLWPNRFCEALQHLHCSLLKSG